MVVKVQKEIHLFTVVKKKLCTFSQIASLRIQSLLVLSNPYLTVHTCHLKRTPQSSKIQTLWSKQPTRTLCKDTKKTLIRKSK